MIGVRPNGEKKLLAVEDGYGESAESWKAMLPDLKRRRLVALVLALVTRANNCSSASFSLNSGNCFGRYL
jgi:transposase-like protein